ncbi:MULTISPECIES: hypothetical protein [Silvimonas]|uniref:hypothetical protein n=1 Tax=Silvimonas TaxID=300264 RepID=UPI0024B3BA0E|nr:MULTISPECIES: hypothetical protein [Silvimonas]MDR3428240.1 hypothetical protein [Silvimonas sp.]
MKRTLVIALVAVVVGFAVMDAVEAALAFETRIHTMLSLAETGAAVSDTAAVAQSVAGSMPASMSFLRGE